MGDAGFVPDLEAWEPWRPDEVAERLRPANVPWAIAGGWAIDLSLGRQTRPHKDIEVAKAREHVPAVLTCLDDLEWFAVGGGKAWPVAAAPAGLTQHWGRDRIDEQWRLDVFAEPWDGERWVFRRDSRITLPLELAIRVGDDSIPFLAPEVVLLFKAASPRGPDEADFERTLPTLGSDQISWLASSLGMAHPEHGWLQALTRD
jgi:hypothetical protein